MGGGGRTSEVVMVVVGNGSGQTLRMRMIVIVRPTRRGRAEILYLAET